MKVYIIISTLIALLLFGCSSKPKVVYASEPVDSAMQEYIYGLFYKKGYNIRSLDDINRELDSMTAAGQALIIRGSDREYDTIIDHVRYRFIKEE